MSIRRRYVLVALFAFATSLLVIASPAIGSPADNPYVGSWVTDDLPIGTELRVQISDSGRFHTWDEEVLGGPCQGGLVTQQGRGEFVDASFVISAPFKRVCHPSDGSDAFELDQLPPGLTITYDHDASTDTLQLTVALNGNILEEGTCYWPRGDKGCDP